MQPKRVCRDSRDSQWVCASAAERVTSLGKDWHRPCLKCEKCGKTLTSGGHAEVRGRQGAEGGVIGAGMKVTPRVLFLVA